MKKIYFDFSLVLLAGIVFYFLFSQCYTTFQHPVVYVPVDSTTYYEQEVTFADDCSQCHEEKQEYVENTTDIYADPVYQQNYNWNYYFVTPWWYDPYYYSGNNQAVGGDEQLAPTQRRDFDRRETPPGPNYAAPAASSPSLAKPRSSNSSNRSTNASPPKRTPRRSTISSPTKKSQPAAPGPKRVSRTESKQKSKKKKK